MSDITNMVDLIYRSDPALKLILALSVMCFAAILAVSVRSFSFSSRLRTVGDELKELSANLREESKSGRDELRDVLAGYQQALELRFGSFSHAQFEVSRLLEDRLKSFGTSQGEQLGHLRREATDGRSAQEAAFKERMELFGQTLTLRTRDTNDAMSRLSEHLHKAHVTLSDSLKLSLEDVSRQIKSMTETVEKRQDAIRETLVLGLESMRKDNETKLEAMRATVEEKLQGTLEQRLGESFKLVSDRLDQVHKGLGEMQMLATGVGDLKRVLTNVKSRGGWGEVQLGALLEDMLSPEQFTRNVRIKAETAESVEYAVTLPGKGDGPPIYLPIDAKFPQEDYDRLLAAQDTGLGDEIDKAGASLERAIRAQAKRISEKYVCPPQSTDFAIMYLPTEGLFAEVIRRPGLCSDIQTKNRVMITGPTTLAALLNSLQMGFRTLAIEKRSSEVWQILSAAKTEFRKYGEVWDKIGKQLDSARKTVDEAGKRTRAVERKLRSVEIFEGLVAEEELTVSSALNERVDEETVEDVS